MGTAYGIIGSGSETAVAGGDTSVYRDGNAEAGETQ